MSQSTLITNPLILFAFVTLKNFLSREEVLIFKLHAFIIPFFLNHFSNPHTQKRRGLNRFQFLWISPSLLGSPWCRWNESLHLLQRSSGVLWRSGMLVTVLLVVLQRRWTWSGVRGLLERPIKWGVFSLPPSFFQLLSPPTELHRRGFTFQRLSRTFRSRSIITKEKVLIPLHSPDTPANSITYKQDQFLSSILLFFSLSLTPSHSLARSFSISKVRIRRRKCKRTPN